MPKLSKIRLTNCKYEGLRKEHENSIFDLTKGEEASHALFTLINGGGKGVMMQFIFQLLLPETPWGKNNGNKIMATFCDHRGNPRYFTSHVVLEWILDTLSEKRLITGIAMKPILKNVGLEEEDTGLHYFLYTYEHDNNGYFSLESLPLYDEKTREATDIDDLERFVDENKRDFIKYSQSSAKRIDGDYHRYLQSRGIHRGEWLNLKKINRSEGGAGDYFAGASDNKAIFDKIIIPALSENIRNYTAEDGDNLVEMFKSNLSITKDLPILIKREGDFRTLIEGIKPLIENADSGARFIGLKDRLIQEGNNIYFILNDDFTKVEKEIEKWEREKKGAVEARRKLDYRKDVLNFNMDLRELRANQEEEMEIGERLREKREKFQASQDRLHSLRVNKLVYHKERAEEEIARRNRDKEKLIESLGIRDIQLRKDQLDVELEKELDRVKNKWQAVEEGYLGYRNYARTLMEEARHKEKKLKAKKAQVEREIIKFEVEKAGVEGEKETLKDHFDPMSLAFPQRLQEELASREEDLKARKEDLVQELDRNRESLNVISEELSSLFYEKASREEELGLLDKEIKERGEAELKIARAICLELLEEYDGALLNHNWFRKRQEELGFHQARKEEDLERIQKTLWEKSINKALGREEYYVPNQDVFKLKEEIQALGIHVETGVEFLTGLDQEEREASIDKRPALLYSLIIASFRDWEIITGNIDQEIFLNNLVPIYIRQDMDRGKEVFKSIRGAGHRLLETDKYNSWMEEVKREIYELGQTMERIREDIRRSKDLDQELVHILRIDSAFTLGRKYREKEETLDELSRRIANREEEGANLERKMRSRENDLDKIETGLVEYRELAGRLQSYIVKLEELKEGEIRRRALDKELDDLVKHLERLDYDREEIQLEVYKIQDDFREWEFHKDKLGQEVKILLPHIRLDYSLDPAYSNPVLPSFEVKEDILLSKIKERQALDQDIAGKDSEIKLIDKDIEILNRQVEDYIMELRALDDQWASLEYLGLGLNEIEIEILRLERELAKLNVAIEKLKSRRDILSGSISQMKKGLDRSRNFILKDHGRPASILDELEDLVGEIDLLERRIISNGKYQQVCIEELESKEKLAKRLEINLNRIKGHYELDIMKGSKDKILKAKLENNMDGLVDDWFASYARNARQIEETIKEGERNRNNFKQGIGNRLEENRLRERIFTSISEANMGNFHSNLSSFESMKTHFQSELLSLAKDKEKAEEAMKQWTYRASIHVIRMVEALKDMVNSMTYINDAGYSFPLVRLKGEERLPKEEREIGYLLEEYFIATIRDLLESKRDIENLDNRELNKRMGDGTIFAKALQGSYPVLLVYKMSEKNEFKYSRARDDYYSSWEAIMKGEGYSPEGSGGQTLSVTTFLIMMIMSFRKKHLGNENPSTVLILDNPFGKASGRHVLDPIFEIADKLNFQLICFAAPEIIKAEISERFPVFWDLKIEKGKIVHGGRIIREEIE